MKKVLKILGLTFYITSILSIIPILASLLLYLTYRDNRDLTYLFVFLIIQIVLFILGRHIKIDKEEKIAKIDAILSTSIAWLLIPIIFSIPYLLSGLNFIDSIFESMSAITTTGFSIYNFNDINRLPLSLIFWRSFEQWIGGLGIIIFAMLILPSFLTINLLKSEGRDDLISYDFGESVKVLIKIYLILTFILASFYSFSGYDFFTSINLAMTSISTGGLIPKNISLSIFNKIIFIIAMSVGATTFRFFYDVNKKGLKGLKKYLETIFSFHFLALVPSLVIFSIYKKQYLIDYLFHAYSAISSSGFSYIDIKDLGESFILYLIILMIVGGMVGSSSGGIKIDRFIILLKSILFKIKKLIYPDSYLIVVKYQNRVIEKDEMLDIALFFSLYILILLFFSLLFTLYTHNLTYSLFEIASALGNAGISLGFISKQLPVFYKILIIISMYLGRLEIFIPIASLYYLTKKIKE